MFWTTFRLKRSLACLVKAMVSDFGRPPLFLGGGASGRGDASATSSVMANKRVLLNIRTTELPVEDPIRRKGDEGQAGVRAGPRQHLSAYGIGAEARLPFTMSLVHAHIPGRVDHRPGPVSIQGDGDRRRVRDDQDPSSGSRSLTSSSDLDARPSETEWAGRGPCTESREHRPRTKFGSGGTYL